MLGFPGEDYTTPKHIERTGGFGDPALRAERLKVLDFGVAKQTLLDPEAQKLTRTGFMVGTPQYISPEQLQGLPVGPPSDLYSLAVVVYEMLTGSLPFLGKTPQKQMLNRLLQSPMPFSMVNNNLFLPPDVEPVLMKALARNVGDRYSSALEFAQELERAARSKAVTSPAIPSFGGEMPAAGRDGFDQEGPQFCGQRLELPRRELAQIRGRENAVEQGIAAGAVHGAQFTYGNAHGQELRSITKSASQRRCSAPSPKSARASTACACRSRQQRLAADMPAMLG